MTQTKKTANPRKVDASDPMTKKLNELEKNHQKEIEAMKRQIEELSKSLNKTEKPVPPATTNIDLDDDIDVISLCNNKLNLSTGGFGKGTIYYFDYFGEVKCIPFRDLKEIIKNSDGHSFLQKGYYQVCDQRARKALRISKIYENLAEAQDLITLFDKDVPTIKLTLDRMSAQQKEMIASVTIDKLFNEENIDMNIVKLIGDSVKKDLVTIANDRRRSMSGGEE